ncbi:SRPBCC domain-containing protein [Luteimonas sp. SJ-92]|uniref:SRPBCC domain-containing protein n=1 Tax=Luteimonas salinisoli TaxID=2752307 RepID=A0A853JGV6_9GAMM|nr:SRPBCC domain-containing protein [Luteimonas salinisoli]NZA27952.1 SRPBCC domain-containing protein [Luteimonas salinisoli]
MSELRDDELLIEREFDAPLALVFRLWADRAHVMRWWGPEEFTTVELDWELTPGRPWRGAMTATRFGLTKFGGTVLEVEPERRIVFTFQWDEDSGRDRDTVATVRFAEHDGRTIQTFHQAPFSSVEVRDSHVGGWDSLFNKQQLYVENFAVAERAGLHA